MVAKKTKKNKSGKKKSARKKQVSKAKKPKNSLKKQTSTRKKTTSSHKKTTSIKPIQKKPSAVSAHTSYLVFALIILLVLVFVLSSFLLPKEPSDISSEQQSNVSHYGSTDFSLYIMSMCPYGTDVEDQLKPVLDELGSSVDLRINYIATKTNEGFSSLHGEKEVAGNIIQLCAKKYEPDSYLDLIVCMNKDVLAIPDNWEACAKQYYLDVSAIKTCKEGIEGTKLLEESIKKSELVGARGSPTIFIDDIPYSGRRDSTSFLRALCARLQNHPACEEIPECGSDADCTEEPTLNAYCENPNTQQAECTYSEPQSIEVIVLNDKQCKTCDPELVTRTNEELFKGVHHRYIDVSSEEGKQLINEFNLTVVPVFFFEKTVRDSRNWNEHPSLRRAFIPAGRNFRLRDDVTRARYFIHEIDRTAYYESIAVSKHDNKPQVDAFFMSACPFSNSVETMLLEVHNLLGTTIEFRPHYVVFEQYKDGEDTYCVGDANEYCSMQGAYELIQDVREYCVLEHYGLSAWFNFTLRMNTACTLQDVENCWKDVLIDLGIDIQTIDACTQNDKFSLLDVNKDITNNMKVTSAPAIFIDGDPYTGPRTPEDYKIAVCEAFQTMPAKCETPLASGASLDNKGWPSRGTCGY